mgnify:CR=1 FL=1
MKEELAIRELRLIVKRYTKVNLDNDTAFDLAKDIQEVMEKEWR